MAAYISQEANEIRIVSCVCERREWELLVKTRREDLPKDIKLLKHKWKRMMSFLNKPLFKDAYSNHLTFKKIRVLSPLVDPVDFSFSIEIMRQQEILSLYYYFFAYS
jgi:hypothetical protein